MNTPILPRFLFLVLLIWATICGCSHDDRPPPPLAMEQIPAEFDKAFKQAKQETRDLAQKVTATLQSKDYAAAYDAVQALCAAPDASKDQRGLAARAMLTIYGLLQQAQSQGDEK